MQKPSLTNTIAPHLVLFEVCPDPPAFIVGERVPVLLEERVDAGDAAVPRVLQVLQCEAAVLRHGLLPLEGVLRPHALRVDELRLPRHDVPAGWRQVPFNMM